MIGPRLARLQSRLASFAEQGFQGAANLLVSAVFARALPHDSFATIGALLAIHYFILGLHRSMIVLPYILDASAAPDDGVDGAWWWVSAVSTLVIAALMATATAALALATGFAADSRWLIDAVALTVVVTPALLLFEFGRRVLYQRRLPATAALSSAIYLTVTLASAWLLTRVWPTALIGGMSWVIGALAGALVTVAAAPPGSPKLRRGLDLWWGHRTFAFWQALTNFPHAIYNTSIVVVVGLFGGAPAAAAFTAARTLTNPAISIVTAVDSLDKPRAARALAAEGLPGLGRSVARTRRLLALLSGSYLGLLILFVTPVLRLTLGEAYVDRSNEIRILAVAFFLICMNQPSETFMIVVRSSKLLLLVRVVTAVVALASFALARPWGVMGAAVALLITQAIHLLDLRIAERIAGQRWLRRQAAAAPILQRDRTLAEPEL